MPEAVLWRPQHALSRNNMESTTMLELILAFAAGAAFYKYLAYAWF